MDTNSQNRQVPWSTWAARDAESLADQIELQAAQAEQTAAQKQALFDKEGTPEEKVAADKAQRAAKELDKESTIASEIMEEQEQWAVEQGELRAANRILSDDPTLYYTDSETRVPEMGNMQINEESLKEFGDKAGDVAEGMKNFGAKMLSQSKDLLTNLQDTGDKIKEGAQQLKSNAQSGIAKEKAGAEALKEELQEDAQAFDAKRSAR